MDSMSYCFALQGAVLRGCPLVFLSQGGIPFSRNFRWHEKGVFRGSHCRRKHEKGVFRGSHYRRKHEKGVFRGSHCCRKHEKGVFEASETLNGINKEGSGAHPKLLEVGKRRMGDTKGQMRKRRKRISLSRFPLSKCR